MKILIKINTCILKDRQGVWSQSCFHLLEFSILKRELRFWPYLYFDEYDRALIWWATQSVSQYFCPKIRGRNLLAEFLDNLQRSSYPWALAFRDCISEITWVPEQSLRGNRGGKSMSCGQWLVLGWSKCWAKISIKAQLASPFRQFLSLITDKWIPDPFLSPMLIITSHQYLWI